MGIVVSNDLIGFSLHSIYNNGSLICFEYCITGLGDGWGTLPASPNPHESAIKELGSHLLQVRHDLSIDQSVVKLEATKTEKIFREIRGNEYLNIEFI